MVSLVTPSQCPPSPRARDGHGHVDAMANHNPSPSSPKHSLLPHAPHADQPMLGTIQHAVNTYSLALSKTNTKRQYDDKIKEFRGFCDYKYSHIPPEHGRYSVNEEKFYSYLFYHVFRSKKTSRRGVSAGHFDPTDFESVISKFNANFIAISESCSGELTCQDIPDPECPVGWSVVEAAMSGLKHLWNTQQLANMNNLLWSQIRTPKIKCLILLVKGRQRRVQKRNNKETNRRNEKRVSERKANSPH